MAAVTAKGQEPSACAAVTANNIHFRVGCGSFVRLLCDSSASAAHRVSAGSALQTAKSLHQWAGGVVCSQFVAKGAHVGGRWQMITDFGPRPFDGGHLDRIALQ